LCRNDIEASNRLPIKNDGNAWSKQQSWAHHKPKLAGRDNAQAVGNGPYSIPFVVTPSVEGSRSKFRGWPGKLLGAIRQECINGGHVASNITRHQSTPQNRQCHYSAHRCNRAIYVKYLADKSGSLSLKICAEVAFWALLAYCVAYNNTFMFRFFHPLKNQRLAFILDVIVSLVILAPLVLVVYRAIPAAVDAIAQSQGR
jgi:hypothetical protein